MVEGWCYAALELPAAGVAWIPTHHAPDSIYHPPNETPQIYHSTQESKSETLHDAEVIARSIDLIHKVRSPSAEACTAAKTQAHVQKPLQANCEYTVEAIAGERGVIYI